MSSHHDVLIVGAGHGGANCAIALRQAGFAGSIGILGDEPDPPYERPPLSKDYLAGSRSFERILIRPPAFWAERGIALRLGARVAAVDAGAHRVVLSDGGETGYGRLVWAAGGSPRALPRPGAQATNVLPIRRRADVDRLKAELTGGQRRVLVVGGGYIGLEAAAVMAGQGHGVTVVEALDRVLSRVTGPALSDFYAGEHRAHGVDLRLSTLVEALELEGTGGSGPPRARAARLSDGAELPVDVVLVGIGIVPEVGPLIAAGAAGGDGVDVDSRCRTSLPDVHAIGDCAAHANRFAGGAMIRLESVQNAHDMGKVVAADLIGSSIDYDAVPWFWSNQYDLRLQTVGLNMGHDNEVLRGDPASRSFSCIYLRDGRVIALDCVNRTRDYAQGRLLVERAAAIAPERLADSDEPLKAMLD